MKHTETILSCSNCPLHIKDMDGMSCCHPYFDDKGAYDNMIITQDNIHDIPEKCPLRRSELIITYKLG